MSLVYRTPGVYVVEENRGVKPIESVGTGTAGFVGTATRADAHLDDPVPITNWLQFRRQFVDDDDGQPVGPSTDLVRAVFGFFQNGGRFCYVVNVGETSGPVPGDAGSRTGVDALDLVDEVAIVAAPGFTDAVSQDRLLTHCENRKDRVAVLDGPAQFDDPSDVIRVATVPVPGAGPATGRSGGTEEAEGSEGTETAEGAGGAPARAARTGDEEAPGFRPRLSERGFGAFYVPWLVIADPLGGGTVPCAPSGHVAGVWARTDGERGVHKAPANTPVRGAVNLTRRITSAEQDLLNPEGVNCIRSFPGQGTLVWGARTVAESASEWKYLNVRRLFSMIEESIMRSTRWIVFEPNDETLWKSIRRDVGAYLTRLWRAGALFGRTPEEAFFVRCDAENNPPESRDVGQVIIDVGIAPVKPAEFVIFRVSQHQASSAAVEEA